MFRAPPSLNKGTQNGIDAGLITRPMRPEPVQHVRVQAKINAALGARNAQYNSIVPAFG